MIMCDITTPVANKNINRWKQDLHRVCEDIPIALCGNIPIVDVRNRQLKEKWVRIQSKKSLVIIQRKRSPPYYEISAKNNYDLEKPFLYLARELTGDPNLHFVKSPALVLPEVDIELAAKQEHEAKLLTPTLSDDNDDAFEV